MAKIKQDRGLEQISSMFLSSDNDEKTPKQRGGLSAVTLRTDASCAECTNMIQGSSREPKCGIFTLEHKKHGVPHLETIDLNFANYCENYDPEFPNKMTAPEPERNAFAGNSARKPVKEDQLKELAALIAELADENCEIEETVTIKKDITYPDTDASRDKIREALFKFLENGYHLDAVTLRRVKKNTTSQEKGTTEEKIRLFIE